MSDRRGGHCLVVAFQSFDRALEARDVIRGNELEADQFEHVVAVYVPPRRESKRIRHTLLAALREAGIAAEMLEEPRLLDWDDDFECYVDPERPGVDGLTGAFLEAPFFHPAESRWLVRVTPKSIWVYRAMRAELARLHRPVLELNGHEVVIGALSETDAQEAIAGARRLPSVGEATATSLSWVGRWRLRQRFLGNYDPGPCGPI